MNLTPAVNFINIFTLVNYDLSKGSPSIHCMCASRQYFKNFPAYSATVVIYARKMFVKSRPGRQVTRVWGEELLDQLEDTAVDVFLAFGGPGVHITNLFHR
jgi:hypothetical protein